MPVEGASLATFAADLQPARFPALPFPAAQPLLSLKLQAVFRRPRFLASPDPQPVLLHLQRALQQNPPPPPPGPLRADMGTNQELGKTEAKITRLIGGCGLLELRIEKPAGVGEDFEAVVPRDRRQRDAGGLRDPHG